MGKDRINIDGVEYVKASLVDQPEPMTNQLTPELGQIWRDKVNKRKFRVYKEHLKLIAANPDNYELSCIKPHDDGDFSYICGFEWCRCTS